MRKVSVMLARFPYQNAECPDSVDWYVKTVLAAKKDPRISEVFHVRVDDTPITMGRNKVVDTAKKCQADYLLMLDSDMAPDLPGEQPFWDTSFDFAYQHSGPCAIAAPYCGPPPINNVYVFQWAQWGNDNPNPDMRLDQYTREEAARLTGFWPAAALPTGLFLIDLRCFDYVTPPYFYYEWKDKNEAEKASTEDVAFTRDLSLAGVPLYCNWSSWAGHWKRYRVDKPRLLSADQVRQSYAEAVLAGRNSREKKIYVQPASNGKAALPHQPSKNGQAAPVKNYDEEVVQRALADRGILSERSEA